MRARHERRSSWFVLAALLAPTGYMIQDAVADAMTVEAVPRVDENGKPYDEATRKSMHTTMQTLGRVALIGGLALVAAANVYLFHGTENLGREREGGALRERLHRGAHHPGDLGAGRDPAPLPQARARGGGEDAARTGRCSAAAWRSSPSRWRSAWAACRTREEIIFAGSLAVILFLLWRLARELEPAARDTLVGDRARAVPLPRGAADRRRHHLVDDRRAQVRRGASRRGSRSSPTR